MKEKITPCFWYNGNATEAAALYCSAFNDTKIASQSPLVTELHMAGQSITLLDGGPMYHPNPSISFFCVCETMEELERAWAILGKEGKVMMALDKYPWSERYGWVADKFDISWQLSLGRISEAGQKLIPSLMLTGDQYGRADEAISLYTSLFKNSKVEGIRRYDANESPDKEGKVKHAEITLNGQKMMIMESAHEHKFSFSEGVSLTIHCEDQEEVDFFWNKLTENGGEESMCGWLKDKFGVSWQVVPTVLTRIMSDPAKAGKAAQAFMSMRKLDIEKIVQASL